jgi:arsenate reductase (thioredoxin)
LTVSGGMSVSMGCMEKEACPTLFIHNLIEWRVEVEDPKGKPIGFAEMLRGLLEVKISKHRKHC